MIPQVDTLDINGIVIVFFFDQDNTEVVLSDTNEIIMSVYVSWVTNQVEMYQIRALDIFFFNKWFRSNSFKKVMIN